MTDCILEAINSSIQAYISALTGRLSPSISRPLVGLRKMIHMDLHYLEARAVPIGRCSDAMDSNVTTTT
jgi:hypothetical protein